MTSQQTPPGSDTIKITLILNWSVSSWSKVTAMRATKVIYLARETWDLMKPCASDDGDDDARPLTIRAIALGRDKEFVVSLGESGVCAFHNLNEPGDSKSWEAILNAEAWNVATYRVSR